MDSHFQSIVDLFKRLIDIGEQQVSLFEFSQSEDAFGNINALEKEKNDLFAELTILVENQLDSYSAEEQEYFRQSMEALLNINVKLESHINNSYESAAKEMNQVSIHRKTINSYGGANSSDVIPYYFDEKK